MERTAAGKLAHVRMAKSTSTKKKAGLDALAGADDPRAPLDAAALLDAARKLLARLEVDLRQRAEASPAVARALREQYDREKAAERTAETFAGWTAALATQVAAAWLLSCVFVRTLEDRGLLRQARIAGPGAIDSQRLFFQLAPSLTERDYLLMVWKELAQYPAARGLFDPSTAWCGSCRPRPSWPATSWRCFAPRPPRPRPFASARPARASWATCTRT
jgi:hypothetical protein